MLGPAVRAPGFYNFIWHPRECRGIGLNARRKVATGARTLDDKNTHLDSLRLLGGVSRRSVLTGRALCLKLLSSEFEPDLGHFNQTVLVLGHRPFCQSEAGFGVFSIFRRRQRHHAYPLASIFLKRAGHGLPGSIKE
jgi:hypothetical protein